MIKIKDKVKQLFEPTLTGTTYKFNDFPFNHMRWTNKFNVVEAHFNVGNPKKGDVIQFGKRNFVIKKISYFHGTYDFIVKELS